MNRINPQDLKTREAEPKVGKDKNGASRFMCPFCVPSHPLDIGKPAQCGALMKVIVTQMVISSRVSRMNHFECLRCHQTGHGDMVVYGSGFVHLENCKPDVLLLSEIPNLSIFAKTVFKMPEKIRNIIEQRMSFKTQALEEIDAKGNKTGKVLGYFFLKVKPNG